LSRAAVAGFAGHAAVLIAGVFLAVGAAQALDDHGQLENPVLQARYEHITEQLRCLVCQNETIADSNAALAGELRGEVRQMLVAGKSDAAIYAFMRARYGEFVLYNPPVDARTVFIWGAPFALMLIGGVVIYRVLRTRSRMPLDEEQEAGPK